MEDKCLIPVDFSLVLLLFGFFNEVVSIQYQILLTYFDLW